MLFHARYIDAVMEIGYNDLIQGMKRPDGHLAMSDAVLMVQFPVELEVY